MDEILTILVDAIKDAPAIVDAVKSALEKKGYSNEEIDGIFAGVLPLDQLGIDPNHPFKPEPGADARDVAALIDATAPKPPTAAQISQGQPFIHATHVPLEGGPQVEPDPAKPAPPNPFERAR